MLMLRVSRSAQRTWHLLALLLFCVCHSVTAGLQPDGACALLNLFPFSDRHIYTYRGQGRRDSPVSAYGDYKRWSAQSIGMTGYTYSAAALLAMNHFNRRDSTVVPELANLTNCTAYFPTDSASYRLRDSGLNNLVASQAILDAAGYSMTNGSDGNHSIAKPVCAIIGPYADKPSFWTTSMTSSLNLPQVFYSSQRIEVTEPDLLDNTARVSLTLKDTAAKILSYLAQHERFHLAIVHSGATYDVQLSMDLKQLGPAFGVQVHLFGLMKPPAGTDGKTWSNQIFQRVKDSGIRTVMRLWVSIGPEELPKLAHRLAGLGLLEDDYMWILEEHMAPPQDLATIVQDEDADSNIDRLLRGALIISPLDGFSWNRDADPFLSSWRSEGADFVRQVNALSPLSPGDAEYFQGQDDFFQKHNPSQGASFVYDSVMAVGIGACISQTISREEEQPSLPGKGSSSKGDPAMNSAPSQGGAPQPSTESQTGPKPRGPPKLEISNPHVLGIVRSKFSGASGTVAFGEHGERFKDRVALDVSFGAYNVRGLPVDEATGKRRYEVVLTSRSIGENWTSVDGESFLFRDGTSNSPGPSRVVSEQNLLPTWARVTGLSLLSISWGVTMALSVLIWLWTDKPKIKAAQPIFLQILLAGSFLTSASILMLSFDEGTGMKDTGLDIACVSTPWLFFLGMVTMYAGLFCKLWRLDKVTQFRRRRVKVTHVLWPLIALLVSTVAMLVAWTIVDPWTWEREMISEIPPVSYGQCQSEHFAAFFSPLCGVMVVATALAVLMAWKTKDTKVDESLTDSNTVLYAVSSQLQAWFVGLPILAVLRDSSVEATYFGRILLIWIFSTSAVIIVVVPKVYRTWREIRNPSTVQSRGSIHISGLALPESVSRLSSSPPSTTRRVLLDNSRTSSEGSTGIAQPPLGE